MNEDRPILSAAKCRSVILVSGGIRFMRIFAEVLRGGSLNDSGVVYTAIFSVFAGYFSDTLEMRPALLYSDMQPSSAFH